MYQAIVFLPLVGFLIAGAITLIGARARHPGGLSEGHAEAHHHAPEVAGGGLIRHEHHEDDHAPAEPAAHGIHPLAFRLPLAAAAWFLVSMALSFTDSLETGYLMAVVVGFGIVFFGLVTGLALRASGSARWLGSVAGFHRFARGDVGIATGRISGHEALVQLTVLPVTLALGGIAIGLVYLLVR